MQQQEFYRRCLLFLLFVYVTESNGASLNFNISEPSQMQNGHRQTRIKKHFLSFDPKLDDIASPPQKDEENIASRSSAGGGYADGDLDPDYPYEKIQKFLNINPHFLKFFPPAIPDLDNRGGGADDEGESLCGLVRDSYYSPQKLKNTRGILKTIINDDKNKQTIEKETCLSDKMGKCSSYKILGFTSRCVQKYQEVRLLTFSDSATEEAAMDKFSVPSCCVCKLKMDS